MSAPSVRPQTAADGVSRTLRAVLLVGSARPRGLSTSEALGNSLLDRLEKHGYERALFWAARSRGEDRLAELTAAIAGADVFVLASPVYVDALPHLVTAALEHIAREPRPANAPPCRFVALLNCGFPEAVHTRVAQEICRLFAAAAGLQCAGALGLGGGPALNGRAPDQMGWFTRHVTRALDLTAEALVAGRPVPAKALELMARPLVPARGYTMIADVQWKRLGRSHGVEELLGARPFEEASPPHPPA